MLGIFNRKNKDPRTFDTGLSGSPAAIRTAAQMSGGWQAKEELVKGCLAAFDKGNTQNLGIFLMAYLEFKRTEGSISTLETKSMDGGLNNLVGKPVVHLLERQLDPAHTLRTVLDKAPPYYHQLLLDVCLRYSSLHNSWATIPVLISAGADINTGRGRPLHTALREGNLRISALLLEAGADADMAIAIATREENLPWVQQTLRILRGEAPVATAENDNPTPQNNVSTPRTVIKKPEGPAP